jgi:hypothetical protein
MLICMIIMKEKQILFIYSFEFQIVVTTTQIHLEQQPQVALRETFPPSTSPSSCSPMSNRPDIDYDVDLNEEEDLARENATIDRLLLEANADLVRINSKKVLCTLPTNRSSITNSLEFVKSYVL